MSAAALDRVINGSGAVTVPDDVHDLIEAVYGPKERRAPVRGVRGRDAVVTRDPGPRSAA